MDNHIFKPGDMAEVIAGAPFGRQVDCRGLYCLVESHPYTHPNYPIIAVDITISVPGILRADIQCLKYIPPEEWPESVFKVHELVLVEKDNGTKRERPSKRRELETTE